MYSIVLMLAVTSGAESPECHRYRSVGCYCVPAPCVVTPYPCWTPVYYYPCNPVVASGDTSGSSSSGSSTTASSDEMTQDDIRELKKLGLTDSDIKELQDVKMTHEKAQEMIQNLKKASGGTDTGGLETSEEPQATEKDINELKALGLTDKDIEELQAAKISHKNAQEMIQKLKKAKEGMNDGAQRRSGRAVLVVYLPADATLTIGGARTFSTSDLRVFVTPPLSSGEGYYYTLKATRVVGGAKQTVSKDVRVAVGRESTVAITFPETSVARK